VTSYLDSAVAVSACSPAPSLPAMRPELAATSGAFRPSASTTAPTVAVAGDVLAKRSQKHFAMAGIDANVWPLSPQDWSSG
jgi:hypothetical protein